MRLALSQMHVEPGEPRLNLLCAERGIAAAAAALADIVLLPETLDCGWTHPSARDLAGPVPGGEACERLRAAARGGSIHVCAGIVERSGDHLYNAALLIGPGGEILLHHRKVHELDFARGLYTCGDRLAVVHTIWGRIGVMICADAFVDGLVISRTLGHMGAKLILSPCSWAVPPDFSGPYGQLWRDSYGPPAKEFGLTIAGCSNTGPVNAGAWTGWQCIGNSLVTGPGGETKAQAAYGVEQLLLIEVPM